MFAVTKTNSRYGSDAAQRKKERERERMNVSYNERDATARVPVIHMPNTRRLVRTGIMMILLGLGVYTFACFCMLGNYV